MSLLGPASLTAHHSNSFITLAGRADVDPQQTRMLVTINERSSESSSVKPVLEMKHTAQHAG